MSPEVSPQLHSLPKEAYSAHVENDDSQRVAETDEKALVRKIDLFLLPTIWLMYLLSYIDRTKFVVPFVYLTI